MSPRPGSGRARPSEAEVVETVRAHLTHAGYRVRVDPDGTDYFDLVARRGDEVGLVEAKVSDARRVLVQALRRRGWGDWTAVALASPVSAGRLAARTRGTRAEPVGIWSVSSGTVTVHREARPWAGDPSADPFADLRARFRRLLDALESGERPQAVRWDDVLHEVRRASGGRGFREWRLDETAPPGR